MNKLGECAGDKNAFYFLNWNQYVASIDFKQLSAVITS